jgi:hypothetical protein
MSKLRGVVYILMLVIFALTFGFGFRRRRVVARVYGRFHISLVMMLKSGCLGARRRLMSTGQSGFIPRWFEKSRWRCFTWCVPTAYGVRTSRWTGVGARFSSYSSSDSRGVVYKLCCTDARFGRDLISRDITAARGVTLVFGTSLSSVGVPTFSFNFKCSVR